MGKLIDDTKLIQDRKQAADLVQTAADLLVQETQNNQEIQTLKTKIAADVAADTWVKMDFIRAGQVLGMKAAITAKKNSYKAELITLKTLVQNTDYETEIQAVIDKL